MSHDWQSYSSASFSGLIRTSFTDTGYTIYISDLHQIWSESLDHNGIVQRARDVNCPIHPEDSRSQLRILLDRIEACLQTCSEDTGTVNPIEYGFGSTQLELQLNIPLPAPLGLLRWKLDLELLTPREMRRQLLDPILASLYLQKLQNEALSRLLVEKDHALEKLLDKIESLGMDFTTVFPTARLHKKGSQREQLVKVVKGLAPFDKNAWTAGRFVADIENVKPRTILNTAFAGSTSNENSSVVQILNLENRAAFRLVADTSREAIQGSAVGPVQHEAPTANTSQAFDSDFQRQESPEPDKNASRTSNFENQQQPTFKTSQSPPSVGPDDESTEDEDDLDAVPSSQALRHQRKTAMTSNRKGATTQAQSPIGVPMNNSVRGESMSKKNNSGKLGVSELAGDGTGDPSNTTSSNVEGQLPAPGKKSRRLGVIAPNGENAHPIPASLSSTVPAPKDDINYQVPPETDPQDASSDNAHRHSSPLERQDAATPTRDEERRSKSVSASTAPKRKLGLLKGRRNGPVEQGQVDQTLPKVIETSKPKATVEDGSVARSIESRPKFIGGPQSPAQEEATEAETAELQAKRRREILERDMVSSKPTAKKKRKF